MIVIRYYLPQLYIEKCLSSEEFTVTLSPPSLKLPNYGTSTHGKKRKFVTDGENSEMNKEANFVNLLLKIFPWTANMEILHTEYYMHGQFSETDVIRTVQEKLTTIQNAIAPLLKFAQRCGIVTNFNYVISFDDVYGAPYLCQRNIVFTSKACVWDAHGTGSHFYIPPQSAFIWDDIRRGLRLLSSCRQGRGRFKAIVCDPPWPNKSAKRGKRYQTTLSREELLNFGEYIKTITDPTGSIIAIWVTNNDEIVEFTRNELLREWGFRYVSTWWWLKVSLNGQPVSEVSPTQSHRKPYERIIIGYRGCVNVVGSNDDTDSDVPNMRFCVCQCQCKVNADLLLADEATPMQHTEQCHQHQPLKGPQSMQFNADKYAAHIESLVVVDDNIAPGKSTAVIINTEVIVSAPVRHSWKPPLHSLLNNALRRIVSIAGDGGDMDYSGRDSIGDSKSDSIGDSIGDSKSDSIGDSKSDSIGDSKSDSIGDSKSDCIGDSKSDETREIPLCCEECVLGTDLELFAR
jgi:N6-adenosine-specific RNA methylase IME4